MALTPKQQRFVDEYLVDLNAAAAARRAGSKAKRSDQAGYELLSNPEVSAAIAEGAKARSAATGITAESVLRRLDEVANRCLTAVPVMEYCPIMREQVQRTEDGKGVWEFDSGGACRALELLGKHLKLFTDKVEHSGKLTLEDLVMGADPQEKP